MFVGEGHARVVSSRNPRHNGRYLMLKIAMYDERAISKFASAVAPYIGERVKSARTGIDRRTYRHNGHTVYEAGISGAAAMPLAHALLVHLASTDKGDQIQQSLLSVTTNPRIVTRSTVRLSHAKAQEIRALSGSGVSAKELAIQFEVTVATIQNVLADRTWKGNKSCLT